MARTVVNIHGRSGGRGWRPWLLIPKVLAVGLYFGALVTVAVIWFTGPRRSAHLAQPQVQAWVDQISSLFRLLLLPALLVALMLGVALFLQHARVFVRLRWWRAKVVSLAVGLPLGHLFMSSRFDLLRQTAGSNQSAAFQIDCGFVVLILWSIGLIVLGRHKPRLGQDWAKSFPPGPKAANGRGTDRCRALTLLAIAAGLSLGSCAGREPDIAVDDPTRPANLSVQFHVVGERAPGHSLRQTSMYVLEPDRNLRVALGYEAQVGFYPRLVRVISPSEYRAIVEFVHERRLMAEPTSPIAEAALKRGQVPPVLYRVDLSAWGLVNRYATTAEESPPTAALLTKLVLAGAPGLPTSSR